MKAGFKNGQYVARELNRKINHVRNCCSYLTYSLGFGAGHVVYVGRLCAYPAGSGGSGNSGSCYSGAALVNRCAAQSIYRLI